jgi:hypothetical protein
MGKRFLAWGDDNGGHRMLVPGTPHPGPPHEGEGEEAAGSRKA